MRPHESPAAIGFPVSNSDLSDDSKSGQLASIQFLPDVSPRHEFLATAQHDL